MNQYRCETCKRPHLVPDGLSRHPHFICGDYKMPYDTATVTSIRGCASHSGFQAEQILDMILHDLEGRSMVGRALEIIAEERGKNWLRSELMLKLRGEL